MKLKISEEKSLTITARMAECAVFLILSLAMIAVLGKKTVPSGRAYIARLDKELQSISFETQRIAVYVGEPLEITPIVRPKNAEVSYTWEIADDGVLDVDNGSIVGAAEGETLLGVTSGDFYASLNVVSKYKPLPKGSTLPPLYYETLPIANYRNTLGADDVPADLIRIPQQYVATNYSTLYVSQETFDAYLTLYRDMTAAINGNMHIISAYRSYARQSELYEKAVQGYMAQGKTSTEARALALETTQTPGNSEHQLGNTIDVSNDYSTDHDYQNTPEGKWLAENAHKYGFIIRYPADKEDITRIEYEPWHIRYVGVNHATYMYVNNYCLEEYVELQQQAREEADEYALTHPATPD